MRVYNDFAYRSSGEEERYYMDTCDGRAEVIHYQFECGLAVNRFDATGSGLVNRDRIGEVDMVGVSACLRGGAVCRSGGDVLRLLPGSCHVGRPSDRTEHLEFPCTSYKGIAVGFVGGSLDIPTSNADRIEELLELPDAFLCPPDALALLHGIDTVLEKQGARAEDAVRMMSSVLLDSLLRSRPGRLVCTEDDVFSDVLCMRMTDGLSLQETCAEHGKDPTVAIRAFSRRYGGTPAYYARSMRLSSAAGMILAGCGNMSVAAACAGYSSESKFAAAFRRRFGIRPKHYRESILGARSHVEAPRACPRAPLYRSQPRRSPGCNHG